MGSVTRRTFLRGVGVSMALPWMESVDVFGALPNATPGSGEAPLRLGVLFAGNGFHRKQWWAEGSGSDMQLGKVLEPLTDFRERMLFIRGLYNEEASEGKYPQLPDGQSALGCSVGTSGGEIRSGTSVDQSVGLAPTDAAPRSPAWC